MRWIKAAFPIGALLLLAATAVFWLYYTTSGVRFLLGVVSRITPVTISAEDIQGYLAREVSFSRFRLKLPGTTISAAKIALSCPPTGLLLGRLDVTGLAAEDMGVIGTGPDKNEPVSLIPPRVPRIVAALEGRIRALRIDRLRILYPSEEPIVIHRIRGRIAWHRGILSVEDLTVGSAAMDVSGNLEIGCYRPSVKSELWADTKEGSAKLNKFFIRSDLRPVFGRAAMTGRVSAWAYKGKDSRVALETVLTAYQHRIDIRGLTVTTAEQQGRITGSGQIKTEKTLPSFAGHVRIEQFRLQDLIPLDATVTGTADIAGTPEAYSGQFTVTSAAKRLFSFKVNGSFQGNRHKVRAQIPSSGWLGGSLTGATTISWGKNFEISGNVNARGLNTGLIDETWQGVINADASFDLQSSGTGVSEANVKARLLNSTFRQRPVKGLIDAAYDKGLLHLRDLILRGRGFDVIAQGILSRRIDFLAHIQDLSSLIPGAAGMVSGKGWFRYGDADFALNLSGLGRAIKYKDIGVKRADISASVYERGEKGLDVEVAGQSIVYGGASLNSLMAVVRGTTSHHEGRLKTAGPEARIETSLTGGYEKGVWKGFVKELKGSERGRGVWGLKSPASLTLSGKGVLIEPFTLQGGRDERITGSVDLRLKPAHGFVKAEWQNLDLSRLDPVLPVSLETRAGGHISLRWVKGALDQCLGEIDSRGGELRGRGAPIPLSQVQATINWTSRGLQGTGQVALAGGGRLQGGISSTLRPRLGLPEEARFSGSWQGFQLSLFNSFLPNDVKLKGLIFGSVDGRLSPGSQVSGTVESRLVQGAIDWRTDQWLTTAAIEKAVLKASLGSQGFKGECEVRLGRYGHVRSSFSLPVPGTIPFRPLPNGPIALRVEGRMAEQGLLSAFFPGLVQETKGVVMINARILGTWAQPTFAGGAELSNAAAYLPTAGISIRAVRARAELSKNNVTVTELHAESGEGRIDGSGVISFKDGRIEKYTGRLSGDRFQAIYLPDLRLLASPSLNLSGTANRLVVEGEIAVPQLHIYGPPTEDVVRSSPDVVLVGAREKEKRKLPIDLLAKVKVVLGDDVRIKMEGIDARLEGALTLTVSGEEDITGVGEIRIAKGRYQTYGVELEVARGRIILRGPLEGATLDILAVRKIEGVARQTRVLDRLTGTAPSGSGTGTGFVETQTVGVQITGMVQKPRISLYSRPYLSDPDTLSYLVLGRPLSGDAAQASLLFSAASTLFGKGEGGSFQDQVKKILGLESLEVGTETYTSQDGQVEQTMVRVGRYVAPNLYIGFGRSLFTDEYIVTARYRLSKRVEIQTRAGARTGGDIYYKVEFD